MSIGCKDDSKAFIFTLKNPYGVPPTRFMKKKESYQAIQCLSKYGPIFGNDHPDIYIADNCNEENSCFINNSYNLQYGYHSIYRSSLFVNTDGRNLPNRFTVLDYEVYSFDICKEYVYNVCKYPDIIWNYIETKDISGKSLEQFDDDVELLSDLKWIQCKDSAIRLKISRYYLKNSSRLLAGTELVDMKYDAKSQKWTGDYNWRLIYRASEHGYTAKSFHECCDDVNGPTLVIIKSSEGWIFGGYTTQSWSGGGIYDDMI